MNTANNPQPPRSGATTLKKELQTAIFKHDGGSASRLWKEITASDPQYTFPAGVQYDLCRVLRSGGFHSEAAKAYVNLIARFPNAPVSTPARLEAALLMVDLPDLRQKAVHFVREYLELNPGEEEAEEARQLLDRLQILVMGLAENPSSEDVSTPAPTSFPRAFQDSTGGLGFVPQYEDGLQPDDSPHLNLPEVHTGHTAGGMRPSWAKASDTNNGQGGQIPTSAAPLHEEFNVPELHRTPPPPSSPSEAVGKAEGVELHYLPPMPSRPPTFELPPEPVLPSPVSASPPPAAPPPPPDLTPSEDYMNGRDAFPDAFPTTPEHAIPDTTPMDTDAALSALLEGVGFESALSPPQEPAPVPEAATPEVPSEKRKSVEEPSGKKQPPEPHAFKIEAPPTAELEESTRTLELEKFKRDQAKLQERQEHESLLQRSRFAAVLPMGKRIHFEEVSRLVADFLNVEIPIAQRRLRRGKGILLDNLTYDEMVEFYHTLLDCRQKIIFVRQGEELDFGTAQEMLSARPQGETARVTTEKGQYRTHCEHVKLISAGHVKESRDSKTKYLVADFFTENPRRHLRLYDETFNYRGWGSDVAESEFPFKNFILEWKENCPGCQSSHTIELVARGKSKEFQVFSSLAEFDNYNRWLILNYFGEQIDPARKRLKTATNY